MKLIIAGSRDLNVSTNLLKYCIIHFLDFKTIKEIVTGGATGVDFSGKMLCKDETLDAIAMTLKGKNKEFLADWDTHGKAAGPIRNKQMADYGDALLLIWDGESRGSKNMKETMLKLDKPVYEVILRRHN